MNVDLYKMVKAAMFTAPECPDGPRCVSCMAESVTHMLEDNFSLESKERFHSVPLEEI